MCDLAAALKVDWKVGQNKIEGIGQIDFESDRLLLKHLENMSCKYQPPALVFD